jgi:hypothetical protein
VSSFPYRSLSGLWANEYVPAYICPFYTQNPHRWLYNESYAPEGTTLPNGVGAQGLGPIGISVTGDDAAPPDNMPGGTLTGFPNSSATNWEIGTNSYQLQLHCTSDNSHGYVD